MATSLRHKVYTIKQKLKRSLKSTQPHYKTVKEYWIQRLPFKEVGDRLDLFKAECEGKDIIHFGCTDWPVFNPENNLHMTLSKYTKSIDGFDIDEEGIEKLRKYVDQDYFSDFKSIPASKKYDVCLIPETIEHVDNVQLFLSNVATINASKFLITAPNCFSKNRLENYHKDGDTFIEVVHPDHNAWYSPYTLKNVIEKYSDLTVTKVYLMNKGGMICCEAKKINK